MSPGDRPDTTVENTPGPHRENPWGRPWEDLVQALSQSAAATHPQPLEKRFATACGETGYDP